MIPVSRDFHAPAHPAGASSKTSDLLRSAVDLFVLAPAHEHAEIRAFADLLGGLLPDAGPRERAHAARQLALRADTPPAVVRALALDTAEVARPVILGSPVLTSSDLVQIMRRGPEHLALVAERLDLASDVVLALGRSIDGEVRAPETAALGGGAATGTSEATAAIETIVEDAVRARPLRASETEAEVALQRALDELAAELEAEAAAHEAETEAARALRLAAPTVAGDIDAFLDRDPAGRWRYIQEIGNLALLAPMPPRRRRGDDPAAIGARLFHTLVAKETDRLADELARAARLERAVADRILTDRHGEALAVTLAALGIDERTATSILLLHSGERAELTHMQDLSAMAGRIGWRTAEHILSSWRGEREGASGEAMRLLDPAERRGVGRESASPASRVGDDILRRLGGEG